MKTFKYEESWFTGFLIDFVIMGVFLLTLVWKVLTWPLHELKKGVSTLKKYVQNRWPRQEDYWSGSEFRP